MIARFVASLEQPISSARLASYRPVGSSELDMVVNYFFNIELSESLYPSLQAFEVALRNSVHAVVTQHVGTPLWFDHPDLLGSWQLTKIADARGELTRRGRPHDADRIVAELMFGFWHSMFNRPFERKLWMLDGTPALLSAAFPQLPRGLKSRQDVWDRCELIRQLRNRVFHYEPIWNDPSLSARHANVLDAIGWISSDMLGPIALCDRFDLVHRSGRPLVEQKVKAHLGIA